MRIVVVNRKTIAGAACLMMLVAGSLLTGPVPADARAESSHSSQALESAPLNVAVLGATLVPGVTADRALQVRLGFTCRDSDVLVERGSGVVVLHLDEGDPIELTLSVGQVQPGSVWESTVSFDWDERNVAHRRMRENATAAHASFVPEAVRTVVVSTSGKVIDAPTTPARPSPVRTSLN